MGTITMQMTFEPGNGNPLVMLRTGRRASSPLSANCDSVEQLMDRPRMKKLWNFARNGDVAGLKSELSGILVIAETMGYGERTLLRSTGQVAEISTEKSNALVTKDKLESIVRAAQKGDRAEFLFITSKLTRSAKRIGKNQRIRPLQV